MFTDSTQMIAAHAKKFPLLTAEQESGLAARISKGSARAAQKLADHNLRLVLSVAHKHAFNPDQLSDLVGEGMVGLCEAVQTFDPEQGRFTTHATYRIRAHILAFIATTSRLVKTDTKTHWKVRATRDQLAAADLPCGPDEVAEAMGTDRHRIRAVMGAREVSTSTPLDGGDEGFSATLGDYLASDLPSPEAVFMGGSTMERIKERVDRFRETLSEKERAVLDGRILDPDPLTLQELGDVFGSSREAMRQIQARVKGKLQRRLKAHWADLAA